MPLGILYYCKGVAEMELQSRKAMEKIKEERIKRNSKLKYAVLGLPRSRTAWLSVFLSQSGIYCHHDGINGCFSMDEYKEKVADCGDSTTGFTHSNMDDLKCPAIIIEKNNRQMQRCVDFCGELGVPPDVVLTMNDYLMSLPYQRIKQSQIDDKLPEIFEYLTGKEYKEQYGRLSKYNIQVPPEHVDRQAMSELAKQDKLNAIKEDLLSGRMVVGHKLK